MKTAELRQAYLSFFEQQGHRIVPSSSLIPHDDPTLLFTNAGMNQFKDPLLGKSDPGYTRATSAQRCVRAGGKHNDLENVGYTARHHTFFEMMGNFSFGDYFKEETIGFAWKFIVDVLKLPEEKIWVTVHPTDDESRAIWIDKMGVAAERVIDLEENFWTMGDTGPCGPCTELFYDHGPDVAGGPPGSADEDGDRYIEFWNLVFPQFDRSADGTLTPLPQPGVDTGMGLERVAAIMQGVNSNYEIDLFHNILIAAGKFAGITDPKEALQNPSLRVIADHIRSSAFLIADGIAPGNEDRAYVLRRIIRRALRHGYMLEIKGPFFHQLVEVLADEMGDAFPIIRERKAHVMDVLRREEERFGETLNQGMELLKKQIAGLSGDTIPGDVVFQLYDTYGFPADLTADVARERGLSLDMDGFETAMEAQRARARAAASFTASLGQKIAVSSQVDFRGYEEQQTTGQILELFDIEGDAVQTLSAGDAGVIILNQTPFYAESGGQVGDIGELASPDGRFRVKDTQVSGQQFIHVGEVIAGSFSANDTVQAQINDERRNAIRRNHSATHLLHAAMRNILGDHVEQKGSLVNDEKLRFDFSHAQAVTNEQMIAIEDMVNAQIIANSEVETQLMNYDQAIERGAMALFGEKYGDDVRVLAMGGDYSVELCGGTHVVRTGDIGPFKVTVETGIAAGVRRIEAVTGLQALALARENENVLNQVTQLAKGSRAEVVAKVSGMADEIRQLRKELASAEQRLAADQGGDLAGSAINIGSAKFVGAKVDGDNKAMMQTLDNLRSQLDECIVVLGHEQKGKVGLVVAVSKSLNDRLPAPAIMDIVGPMVGAKGGGRADLARAGGGDNPDGLEQAFAAAQAMANDALSGD